MKKRKPVTVAAETAPVIKQRSSKTKSLVLSAAIAAIYAVLTLLLAPISYGPVQLRVAEVMTVLPIFTSCAVPGLTVGCIVANLFGGFGLYDIIFGSLATLLGGLGTRALRKKPIIAVWPPVLSNAVIVGSMLYFVVPDSPALLWNIISVGLSQMLICVGLGIPFIWLLKKYPRLFLQ
ncbi:MAG: QueT transporter family protein [Ruminococcaceae bacterium]|nr:QueT transporter family protein [Oscillospiraceae bacterium]